VAAVVQFPGRKYPMRTFLFNLGLQGLTEIASGAGGITPGNFAQKKRIKIMRPGKLGRSVLRPYKEFCRRPVSL
jgi:hypothetical protein